MQCRHAIASIDLSKTKFHELCVRLANDCKHWQQDTNAKLLLSFGRVDAGLVIEQNSRAGFVTSEQPTNGCCTTSDFYVRVSFP